MAITFFNEKPLSQVKEQEEQRELSKEINQTLLEAIAGIQMELEEEKEKRIALEKRVKALESK